MTPEERANEAIRALPGGSWDAMREAIAAAIRAAEDDALEQAEQEVKSARSMDADGWVAADEIIKSIRALKHGRPAT